MLGYPVYGLIDILTKKKADAMDIIFKLDEEGLLSIMAIAALRKEIDKIKCACLGDVFNLPMSTVTIVEDLTMVAMALFMLIIP